MLITDPPVMINWLKTSTTKQNQKEKKDYFFSPTKSLNRMIVLMCTKETGLEKERMSIRKMRTISFGSSKDVDGLLAGVKLPGCAGSAQLVPASGPGSLLRPRGHPQERAGVQRNGCILLRIFMPAIFMVYFEMARSKLEHSSDQCSSVAPPNLEDQQTVVQRESGGWEGELLHPVLPQRQHVLQWHLSLVLSHFAIEALVKL